LVQQVLKSESVESVLAPLKIDKISEESRLCVIGGALIVKKK